MTTTLRRLAASALIISTVILIAGCLGDDPAGDGGDMGPVPAQGPARTWGSYRVEGTRLVLSVPVDTIPNCQGNRYWPYIRPAGVDTLDFRIQGDSLFLQGPSWAYDDSTFFRSITTAARIGKGKGLEGTWRREKVGYQVAAGSPNQQRSESMDINFKNQNLRNAYEKLDLVFEGGKASTRGEFRFADKFVAAWNGEFWEYAMPDSAMYAITLSIVDQGKLEMQGLMTGEKVTVTFDDDEGAPNYSSSNPDRKPYLGWGNSDAACSMDQSLDWFQVFQKENQKAGDPVN